MRLSWSQKDWSGVGRWRGRNWIINKRMQGRNYGISRVEKASTQLPQCKKSKPSSLYHHSLKGNGFTSKSIHILWVFHYRVQVNSYLWWGHNVIFFSVKSSKSIQLHLFNQFEIPSVRYCNTIWATLLHGSFFCLKNSNSLMNRK